MPLPGDSDYEAAVKELGLHRKKLIWITLDEWKSIQDSIGILQKCTQALSTTEARDDDNRIEALKIVFEAYQNIDNILSAAIMRVEDSAEG